MSCSSLDPILVGDADCVVGPLTVNNNNPGDFVSSSVNFFDLASYFSAAMPAEPAKEIRYDCLVHLPDSTIACFRKRETTTATSRSCTEWVSGPDAMRQKLQPLRRPPPVAAKDFASFS
jgi:hypothetical protein